MIFLPEPSLGPLGRRADEAVMAQALMSEADDFGARLLLAMNALNLSRGQLSAMLGVHKSMVSRWLSGEMKPTGYNLARLSAEFAKAKPGFNMSLWTVPRADFEAALGVAPHTPAPVTVNFGEAGAPRVSILSEEFSSPANPPMHRLGMLWRYGLSAATIFLILVFGSWMLWRKNPPAPPQRTPVLASVAVLPFMNMSGDPAMDYLGDGMSEEILNDLSNTPNLRVAARTSSFSFKGGHAAIDEIARKLNVRAVLEGSVRPQGDRVRIVAQLIDASNGFHLWSARYDRKLDDILAVQDEIARAIVVALTKKLTPPRRAHKIDPKAYQDYLQAQYFFNQRTEEGYRRTIDLLKDGLVRQPDFAQAYALRGRVLMLLAGRNEHLRAESRQLIAKALALDPSNREAIETHLQQALRLWDWDAVYRDGHRLLALGKRDAVVYDGIAWFYQYMGFPAQALEARRGAAELDPLYFAYKRNFAIALSHVGQLAGAIAAAQIALELQPHNIFMISDLCAFNAQAGRLPAAREYRRQILAQYHAENLQACDIEIAFQTRPKSQARALIVKADRPEEGHPTATGALFARSGDFAAAMMRFSQAYDERDFLLMYIRYDAQTPKALLTDPRWLALWQRPLLRDWQRYHDKIAADLKKTKAM